MASAATRDDVARRRTVALAAGPRTDDRRRVNLSSTPMTSLGYLPSEVSCFELLGESISSAGRQRHGGEHRVFLGAGREGGGIGDRHVLDCVQAAPPVNHAKARGCMHAARAAVVVGIANRLDPPSRGLRLESDSVESADQIVAGELQRRYCLR